MSDPAAVEARDVAFAYGERSALSGVSFTVPAGGVHGFLGPNGSGKSTLFKILATILPVQAGDLRVAGLDLRTDMARVRKQLGVVFQSPALDKKLTVRENLRYGGHLYGLAGAELERRIDAVLERGSLTERAKDPVSELSGGLRRRVEIAKGTLHDPGLVLLDEPSTGLDPTARKELWRFLRAREGLTVLFTTHLMDEAEEADRLTILDEGAVVAEDTPQALKQSVAGELLELSCDDPSGFAADIAAAFEVDARALDESVRVRGADVHAIVPDLMRRFADRVSRLTISHPSLEDVFIERTGRRLSEEQP